MKGKEERKRGGDGGRKMSVFQCDTYSVLPVLMSTHWSHTQCSHQYHTQTHNKVKISVHFGAHS